MTNNYGHLESEDLLKELGLILMVESITFCQDNQEEYVKYGTLRKLCNDKLNLISEGKRPDFGGTFESLMKKLANPEIANDKRYMTRITSDVTRKDSKIFPNVPLIMSHVAKVQSKKQRQLRNRNSDSDTMHRSRGLIEPARIHEQVTLRVKKFAIGKNK